MQSQYEFLPVDSHILVVDDEPEVRQMLADLLEFEGYQVSSAEDGEVAQKLLKQTHFDIVLTDLHMPNVDGMELIESLRRIQPDLPVIVITGYPSLSKVIEVMKIGAVDFLPKPFDTDTVVHVVRRTIKEKFLTSENQRLVAAVNNNQVIEQLNRALHSKVSELTKLNTISEQLGTILDTNALFDHVVQLAAELTNAKRVSLMLYDRKKQVLRIRASRGLSSRIMRETKVKIGEGVAGKVAQTKTAIRVTRRMAPGTEKDYLDLNRYSSDSWISVPLLIGDELFAVLNVSERRDGSCFSAEDERILKTLAEKASAKVENNALYESLYENLLDTLRSLVSTIEAKDPCTHRHSQRVTDIAVSLGEQMKLSNEDVESLRFATILHDIGKIGVRDYILTKNGLLDDCEYSKIKMHPLIGIRIVEPLGLTRSEQSIIRSHHERVDGTGYPDGWSQEDIPLLARIVSVADAFDAMTSTRSYRRALSIPQAMDELRRCSGTQFDAEIVNILISGVKSGAIKVSPPEERLPVTPAELVI